MIGAPWSFTRPDDLQATAPPEFRGLSRDGVRLLVSSPDTIEHRRFRDLPSLLRPGDLLVVNESATLPARLPAEGSFGPFDVHLSTWYGRRLWLAEPRWSAGRPGPLPLAPGETFRIGDLTARFLGPYPGLPRLAFLDLVGDVWSTMRRRGEPIRYGYVPTQYPLDAYQTMFARVPGSAEMPSAARPFTPELRQALETRGVGFASIVLHAGVSSLETDPASGVVPVYPEPFEVPLETVRKFERTRAGGGRVIAVGTTVVRALESARANCGIRPIRGFTRRFVSPSAGVFVVDGLLTGFHDPNTSHLAMLEAVAGQDLVARSYAAAIKNRYLWHEFGDSHLIFRADSLPRAS